MNSRIKNINRQLKSRGLDCLILSSPANITYLTGYPSRDAHLIVSAKENIYLADARYLEEVKTNLRGFTVKKQNGPPIKALAGICRGFKFKSIGFEENSVSFGAYSELKEDLGMDYDLVPTANLTEGMRQIKTAQELGYIRKAAEITIAAFEYIKGFIKPGKKELEIAAELERFIRYQGAFSSAFDIIVASGPNSRFPHHMTCQRRIRNNELVLLDVGVDYRGYKSDLTRVFFLGKINPLAAKVYDIVRKAQNKAIARIRPSVKISQIDRAARQHISRFGYGGFFSHALGHGIGLEIHEGPSISPKAKDRLKKGMVFTLEPAVYIPGKFGIRIEDIAQVTEKGVELISGALNKRS